MVRPSIKDVKKKRKQYKRVAVEYRHKKELLDYFDGGHTPSEALDKFYGDLTGKERRAKQKKLISKWRTNVVKINLACTTGHSRHLNLRQRGMATVLSKRAEEEIVMWINTLRKDGAPVSRTMLKLKARDTADERGLNEEQFSASSSWMQLFMRRHRFSLRTKTRQGQTTPEDAAEAAQAFREEVLRTIVEHNCVQVFNADQTAVFFEYVPKKTINTKGSKTVWIRCANKDKQRATVMLLGDSSGNKFDPFILFKSSPATKTSKQEMNNKLRQGFGTTVWREVKKLQEKIPCRIYGNKTAWWNAGLSQEFLEFHFANRVNRDDNVLLLWDDFSGHWTPPVVACAASLNAILLKVPPKYTYVCQPADISWNKPFKGLLRSLWIDELKEQLLAFKQGESERLRNKKELETEISRVQKTQDQENASQKVAALRKKIDNEKFKLVGPSRKDMTRWITSCWDQLSADTIISGFSKAGLVTDTRRINPDEEKEIDVDGLVEDLERHNLAEEELTSDDDIGSDFSTSDNESDDEDIGRN